MKKLWGNRKKERELQEHKVQLLEWQLQQQASVQERQEYELGEKKRQEIEDQARRLEIQEENRRLQWEIAQKKDLEARQESERLNKERLKREHQQQRQDERMRRLHTISTDTLRELRDLIRIRYELDVEIWSLRKVRKPDRPIVEEKMERADAVLTEIFAIVRAWDSTEKSWTKSEWEKAKDIQKRILADGKRQWSSNPPWEDD